MLKRSPGSLKKLRNRELRSSSFSVLSISREYFGMNSLVQGKANTKA